MTWDLLFNLEGAWHLHNGQVAHVDFHDPLGTLNFALTALGFRLVGLSADAFVAGELLAVAVLFGAAFVAVLRRLPLLPAVLFVVFVCQLVLMPVNVGDVVTAFTFAMTYNAIGWSALSVFSLILFLPPRGTSEGRWEDTATGVVLMLALYHLKITYFVAAMVELAIALMVCPHIRAHALGWRGAGCVVLIHALAPWNWPYLGDIRAAIGAGAANTDPVDVVVRLFANLPELSLLSIGFVLALWLWRSRQALPRLPLAVGLLTGVACGVILQNSQERGLVLSIVVALLLYDHFRGDPAARRAPVSKWMLLSLLVLPAASVIRQSASLAAYAWAAERSPSLFTFERTALQGLSVPAGSAATMDPMSYRGRWDGLFSEIRAVPTDGEEISQYEYAQSLLDAADLFDDPARRQGAMVVLDQVNPLPFMLQRPPPRGGALWLDLRLPWQPPEQALCHATYVLVPKFSTYRAVTVAAFERYGPYIAEHFAVQAENRSWLAYGRRRGM